MITLQEFLDKYLGKSKGYPTDTQYAGECLSIVKLYIKECFGIDPPPSGTNSAYGYWSNFPNPLGTVFEKVTNTSTLITQKGWIAIWKPWSTNQSGHIAIVDEGCTATRLLNFAQNWTSKVFQKESNTYTNVIGFLKKKESIIDDMVTEEQKRILQFLEEQGANEGKVREAFGSLTILAEKEKQIQTLQAKVLDLDKFVKELQDRVTALESNIQADLDLIEDWQSKVEIANKLVETTNKELEDMTTSKNQYKNWYEAKCDELKELDKMTALEHIFYGIKKLFVKSSK